MTRTGTSGYSQTERASWTSRDSQAILIWLVLKNELKSIEAVI